MWFKHRAWIPVAWALSIGNIVAVWFAARPGEPWHATIHALLAVAFGIGAQYLQLRKRSADADVVGRVQALEARLANPEQRQVAPALDPAAVAQALDAIAVEVERIGESQRYLTKLLIERDTKSSSNRSS